MRCEEEKEEEEDSFLFSSFVTFLFIIDITCPSFIFFNVFFYFAAYILERAGKKEKKNASFMSGVFLCASPFSQVTRLKVKKSDKFYIPSTFCDYLKGREKKKQ